jgi:hypothetical protein
MACRINRLRAWVRLKKTNMTLPDKDFHGKRGRASKATKRRAEADADAEEAGDHDEDDDEPDGGDNDNDNDTTLNNLLHAAEGSAFLGHYADGFGDLHALPDDISISVPSLYTTTQQQQ